MDPNANREEQLRIIRNLIWQHENGIPVDRDDILRLAELIIDLDNWIANGGFLPQAWSRAPNFIKHDAWIVRTLSNYIDTMHPDGMRMLKETLELATRLDKLTEDK